MSTNTHPSDKPDDDVASPAEVDPQDGTDENDRPIDNPSG
jgi:hypothetical protein